ncbi:hypothetical protein KEJ49_01505 [Candidatus Bathyarchaeota archaeon]|nr:hypothetical protein [Candidatus Bathyarchaeota archaeon]
MVEMIQPPKPIFNPSFTSRHPVFKEMILEDVKPPRKKKPYCMKDKMIWM